MGINIYTLLLTADYTLCIEILNTDYQLWHKAKVSVDRATSKGLTIGSVSVKKFSHRYLDSKKQSRVYVLSPTDNLIVKNSSITSVFSSSTR